MGVYQHISTDINLNNFNEGFNAWEGIAKDNGKRVERNESIKGISITTISKK
ncbi:MAG: hypothetical protein WBZ36_16430 [Candidatus Nitrosopolaris sp.]|jgi:hypothetical protein